MEFEDAFDRQIPDEDAEKMTTVGAAVNYIMDLIKEPSPG
jgi:acyl carrier protein